MLEFICFPSLPCLVRTVSLNQRLSWRLGRIWSLHSAPLGACCSSDPLCGAAGRITALRGEEGLFLLCPDLNVVQLPRTPLFLFKCVFADLTSSILREEGDARVWPRGKEEVMLSLVLVFLRGDAAAAADPAAGLGFWEWQRFFYFILRAWNSPAGSPFFWTFYFRPDDFQCKTWSSVGGNWA